ncbi:hypothetical protein HPB50_010080 [Hyalomma asiaticum]|uniref:Uncharacterized protein n=1 Tax=Hyalomma asiaticum TaxID=266040 RepID=A0ACB7TFT2_HYAAI|nr:hypothetical protein HPB50_010080 [Hyalomma asiaticum]
MRYPPVVVLLRNAMEDLAPETELQSLAAFAVRADTNALSNGGGEEHCRPPCTASRDQVCQINDCLLICNELLSDIRLRLRKQRGTSFSSYILAHLTPIS